MKKKKKKYQLSASLKIKYNGIAELMLDHYS